MTKSFNSFMRGIIDYAGMFPPANLELTPAFRNYLDYISSDDEWMMDKFVCTRKSFESFTKNDSDVYRLLKEYDSERRVSFTLLLTGGKTAKDFLTSFEADLKHVKDFAEKNASTEVNSFEVKLPEELFDRYNKYGLQTFLKDSCEILKSFDMQESVIFFEPPVNNNYEFVFEKLAHTSTEMNDACKSGFKLRTGGIMPELFPSTQQVSFALKTCRDNKVRFKATAGLHHPVRHYNDSVSTKMHGFLNVFGAGILAYSNPLSLKEINDVIKDERAESFMFTAEEFKWNEITADADSITKARNEFVNSFGSCSFDEPKDDLKKLNLL